MAQRHDRGHAQRDHGEQGQARRGERRHPGGQGLAPAGGQRRGRDGEGSLNIGKAEEGTRVTSKSDAQKSIAVLDTAITQVNEYRAYLGAIQNRLGSTIQNLSVTTEALSTAQSRIRDTDFAEETAKMTSSNILQQAGTAVLSQANQQPRIAMSLLQNL